MICPSCKQEVAAAKFCSNCAASLGQGESRTASTIDLGWIMEVYRRFGFKVEAGSASPPTSFLATSDAYPNFFCDYRESLRTLVVTSNWTIKPPGLLDKNEFWKTINSLNQNSIYVQCSVPEKDLTTLSLQLGFFICETVLESDLAMFNDFAIRMVRRVINEERLKPYIK